MAYIRIPEEGGSWYGPEEGQVWARRPAEPARTAGWGSYSFAAPTGWGLGSCLGQPPGPAIRQCPRSSRTYLGQRLAAVLDRFDFDVPKPGWLPGSALKPSHRPILQSLAQEVVVSWSTQQPIRLIHLVGHTDPVGSDEYNRNLGGRRALEVQNALKAAIEALRPGLSGQITFIADTEGEQSPMGDNRTQEGRACNRRVEVFLPVQPPPPPPLPPPPAKVRIPTPQEAARKIEQERQEREEREGKPLPPRPPAPPKPRPFGEMLWRWVDGKLDDVLNRFPIPRQRRAAVRDLLHRAIQSESESLLGQGLDALGVPAGAKQAVLGVFRAATQQKSL